MASKSSTERAGPAAGGIPPGWQPLARLLRAHGVRGTVHLRLTIPIRDLVAWPIVACCHRPPRKPFPLPLGQLKRVGPFDVHASLCGAWSREAAAALGGATLYLPASVLPPAGEDEVYLFTLLGRLAVSEAGAPIGRIVAFYDHGAGTIVALCRPPFDLGRPLAEMREDLLLPMAAVRIVAVSDEGNEVTLAVPQDLIEP